MNLEIKNRNEILRIYENNAKKAKNDAEKTKWENLTAKVKKEISDLEAAE